MSTVAKLAAATAALGVCLGAIASSDAPTRDRSAATALRLLPMAFEDNVGQYSDDIAFVARGLGYGAALNKSGGAVLRVASQGQEEPKIATIGLSFAGARMQANAEPSQRMAHLTNYFIGSNPSKHKVDVPSYARVRFDDVYDGVDVVYYGTQTKLEYDLVVRPGGDPAAIELEINGAAPSVDAQGDLVLETGAGAIKQLRPIAYQQVGRGRSPVAARYVVADENRVRIVLGDYDKSRDLVIDPVLTYSTFVGGKGTDEAIAVAVDAAGNAYVTGMTTSSDFATTSGVVDTSLGRNDTDAFVVKLNPTASALLFSTYLGNSAGWDRGSSIQVDALGSVYVGGETVPLTVGTTNNFPTTTGAYQTTPNANGNSDGFVAKLSPTGSKLVYSTYIRDTRAGRIAVDIYGQVYVTGIAFAQFVTTPGVIYPNQTNGADAFVAKLNASGSALIYGTFLAGAYNGTTATAIAIDTAGNAYVGGYTQSFYFPTVSPLRQFMGGARDGFVTKFNPTASALLFSTYVGGNSDDKVNAVAVDGAGAIYVAGSTTSSDLPVTNAVQSARGHAFLAKILPDYSGYSYYTYLGPNDPSGVGITGLAVDATGFATATGVSAAPLPTQDQVTGAPPSGLFVSRFDPSGQFIYSTFVGGSAQASSSGASISPSVAVDAQGNAYVVGNTGDSTFKTTPGVVRTALSGQDAFALKLGSKAMAVTIASDVQAITAGQSVTFTSTVKDNGVAVTTGAVAFLQGDFQVGLAPVNTSGTATLSITTLSPGVLPLRAVYRGSGEGGGSPFMYLTVNQAQVCN